jgi:hypothetical protein
MSLIGLRPARCLTCNKRFYARYSGDGSQPDQTSTGSQNQSGQGQPDQTGKDERGMPRNIHLRKGSNKAA